VVVQIGAGARWSEFSAIPGGIGYLCAARRVRRYEHPPVLWALVPIGARTISSSGTHHDPRPDWCPTIHPRGSFTSDWLEMTSVQD